VTGQHVEVVTAPWGRPNANWLNFIVTSKARSNIRNYLKNLRSGEATELGHRLLTQALAAESMSIEELDPQRLSLLLNEYELQSMDDLLQDLGLGKRIAPLVARRLLPHDHEDSSADSAAGSPGQPVYVRGTEGMVISFARCCHPIPGDSIVGFVSSGRGIVVHSTWCKNIAEYADQPEKWVEVDWEPGIDDDFPVEIRVDSNDQKGVLATIAAAIAGLDANIENISMENRDGLHSTLLFTVSVHDRQHLAKILRRVRSIPQVARITRGAR
jgi:(p)ppGpp synthase/HD superfamily hydrolase